MQNAHEREVATCHETVRLLKQRLNERDELFATQKRRKLPVDYYALKAKVCCSCSSRKTINSYNDNLEMRDVKEEQRTSRKNTETVQVKELSETLSKEVTAIDINFMIVCIILLYNIRFVGKIFMTRWMFYVMVAAVVSFCFMKIMHALRNV